jgi:hypothetical protein
VPHGHQPPWVRPCRDPVDGDGNGVHTLWVTTPRRFPTEPRSTRDWEIGDLVAVPVGVGSWRCLQVTDLMRGYHSLLTLAATSAVVTNATLELEIDDRLAVAHDGPRHCGV